MLLLGLACLAVASQPFVGAALLRAHQSYGPLPAEGELPEADAIVVLAAGLVPFAPSTQGPDLDELTLARVRYTARLARRTELPVLTSGGVLFWHTPPMASMMAKVLTREFRVKVRWHEKRSQTTAQNAAFSAPLLHAEGVERILLVTHAWHMPRAKRTFERMGFEVIPAPTAFRSWPTKRWVSFMPSPRAMQETRWALHEALGRIWYRMSGSPELPESDS
ncbi:MAG: uncharacterized SAM-binding protein YcdF (DUF218 family) [Planctomycetota bacterium]|jgi:uncharacterized SAM-binding protein YcdF (DUF218 family)